MRIAFYAPLKAPTHPTPSGDRRVARLLMQALARAGHQVELASDFRSYDGTGDAARQAALRDEGRALGRRLAESARPDLWFTYHSYYKAPDWVGPEASTALGIPYVIAEASHAAKRDGGPWDLGQQGAAQAIRRADLLLCPIRDDVEGLRALVPRARIELLPPFLEVGPFRTASQTRGAQRAKLAREHELDEAKPWIVVAAMMRPGDKLASYRALGEALALLVDLPWQLLIAGDGAARGAVEAALGGTIPGRASFLGALDEPAVAALYAAGDFCVWPGVNEAYGMALLEAQAAGLPVVSCATRGVPDVVGHGRTGLLAPPGDASAFAACVRELLVDAAKRRRFGAAAAAHVVSERSLENTARKLNQLLPTLTGVN
jgi:glycosyltransferase involved in cell wall biosynthesis